MFDLKTIEVKREMIKYLLGDDFYNNLCFYQKFLLFKCISKKEIEWFTRIKKEFKK